MGIVHKNAFHLFKTNVSHSLMQCCAFLVHNNDQLCIFKVLLLVRMDFLLLFRNLHRLEKHYFWCFFDTFCTCSLMRHLVCIFCALLFMCVCVLEKI